MPHGFVFYTPGFAGKGFDMQVLTEVRHAIRTAGAEVFQVEPEKISFVFKSADHRLDDLGRDFRVILIHPIPDADENALSLQISDAVDAAIRVANPTIQSITFSVSLCLGRMGFSGLETVLFSS